MGMISFNGVNYSSNGSKVENISEEEYQALVQAGEVDPNTIYFRYDGETSFPPVQNDGNATSLIAESIPTGQTIDSVLSSKIGNFCIRTLRYQIANNTSAQIFDYPTGFAGNIIIAAKIETVYNSVVDYTYNGDNSYYGNVVYGAQNFSFTPKVAGNAKYITFFFLCWN